MKISVVISAYNEEEMIKDCLESVTWADEIILVDNESTDKTVEISRKYTDKIFSRPNNPLMLNLNKNFGFTKARGDWILSLDADERVSEELKKEIKEVLQPSAINHQSSIISHQSSGYLIPRRNIIFGKWIQHGLWFPDYQLRLFLKGKGKFPGKHNHELLEVKGGTGKLKEPIIHYNYTSVNQYLTKITYYYSDNEVKNFLESGKTIHWYDAIRMPASDFLTNFFARSGYKDGLHGLLLALLQAFYTLIVFTKIWEKQGFWEYDNADFLSETKTELSSKGKELKYWIDTLRNNNTHKVMKLLLKLKQRLFT